MKAQSTVFKGRKAWEFDNEALRLVMTQGGGHIASLTLHDGPRVNPMWVPVWKTIEPWQYRPSQAGRLGSKLLANICGHNLCLGWFGDPSPEEEAAGMVCHGEAPSARWKLIGKRVSKQAVSLTSGCELPAAQMRYVRTLTSRKGSNVIRVKEQVRSLSARDLPFTMCQHVTVGPPFLEKGVTVFDMPATLGHTHPGDFGPVQRLKQDKPFAWPKGPGSKGEKVDLRMIAKKYRVSSDFTTQLMDPKRDDAWFTAVNPKQGLLLAYVWDRADYPWIGNWEENYARKEKPWAGKSLTRGLEFANTPFPIGLRPAVDLGTFHGQPTFRWLPARKTVETSYSIVLKPVPRNAKGVADVRRAGNGFEFDVVV